MKYLVIAIIYSAPQAGKVLLNAFTRLRSEVRVL
jgi:hypothetical protein